jgi:hypothetical protein
VLYVHSPQQNQVATSVLIAGPVASGPREDAEQQGRDQQPVGGNSGISIGVDIRNFGVVY